jgi:hypothetical protein
MSSTRTYSNSMQHVLACINLLVFTAGPGQEGDASAAVLL